VKIFRFGKDVGRPMEQYQSSSIIYSQIAQISSPSNIGCMHIEPEGIVGFRGAVNILTKIYTKTIFNSKKLAFPTLSIDRHKDFSLGVYCNMI